MKKRRTRGILIGIIILFLLSVVGIIGWKYMVRVQTRTADLQRVAEAEYDSVFISMNSLATYREEDFITYRGVTPVFADYEIDSLEWIAKYLESALESDNIVTNVYLGLDPWVLREQYRTQQDWQQALQEGLIGFFTQYEGVHFEIMLPHPRVEFWLEQSEDPRERIWESYELFVKQTDGFTNVACYFMGAEKWLIANPANYTAEDITNPVISKKLMLYTFCDRKFRITGDTCGEYYRELQQVTEEQSELRDQYPDYSDKQFVFFGDSVIGNYEGSYSIPGVVSGLSGADTYNYAIGGSRLSRCEDKENSFTEVLELFLTGDAVEKDGKTFLLDEKKDTYFFILYGFNDYFEGALIEQEGMPLSTDTFKGALRTGIHRLQEEYPQATIVVLTPAQCKVFSYGQDKLSAWDDNLEDYIRALEEVAAEESLLCINAYDYSGITRENLDDYLADDCHPNEAGRFLYAEYLLSRLAK